MPSENHAALNEALDAYWANRHKDMERDVRAAVQAGWDAFISGNERRGIVDIITERVMDAKKEEMA